MHGGIRLFDIEYDLGLQSFFLKDILNEVVEVTLMPYIHLC